MIKRNPDYVLRRIADVNYLLPYGQCVADNQRGTTINESGAVLWQLIGSGTDREKLLEDFLGYYELKEEQREEVRQDVDGFLAMLLSQKILYEEETPIILAGAVSQCYQIGAVSMQLTALPEMFPKELEPYKSNVGRADLVVELKLEAFRVQEKGKLLVRNEEIMVFEKEKEYLIQFSQATQLVEAYLSKKGNQGAIYYVPTNSSVLSEELFHALRFLYLYAAQKKENYAVHSASILYRDKAWLFSGASGTGKSTHAKLWNNIFDVRILNGDVNLIGLKDGEAFVYGVPWCGTSGISSAECHPLGGIVLLKQAERDLCVELSKDQRILQVVQRMISPVWTASLLEQNICFAEQLEKNVAICRLECTKNDSAAEIMKKWIDNYLN